MESAVTDDSPPIACTLAFGEFRDRLAWIAELTRDALLSYGRDDLVLDLRYAPAAVDRVRELVRREQACCGFLSFDLREHPSEIQLTIRAPEAARAAADLLFHWFVTPSMTTPAPQKKAARLAAVASATGAVVCSVYCVLPFALPAVLLASTGSALAWLAGAHRWVATLALLATASAWIWIWRQSSRTGARPARSTLYMMGLATAFLALALVWPLLEPYIVRSLRGTT
jgi:hypothetical protein